MEKLLSICIPTFNRANYLKTCLTSIVEQLDHTSWAQIELIVIDNDSEDNTKALAEEFINKGYPLQYHKNDTNIGLDGNLTRAFEVANGKYVQVLGDDDLWISDKIKDLLELLVQGEYGVVYLKPYSFTSEELPMGFPKSQRYYIFQDGNEFVYNINIMITFTSSNIVNKQLVMSHPEFKLNRFLGTEVNLLNWIFTAALHSKENVITKDYFIGSKADNNSGYKFFKVFGINFNLVLDYFKTEGLKTYVVNRINYMLTVYFFPKYLEKINGDNWTYDDNQDEIKSFLATYRNGDQLNKIFLRSILNKDESAFSGEFFKSVIRTYHRVYTKAKQWRGLMSQKIYILKVKEA
jgi:abequosyltransferase